MNPIARLSGPRYLAALAVAGVGLALALAWIGSPAHQLIYVTVLVISLLAVAVTIWSHAATLSEHGELFSAPLALAQDREILDLYRSLSSSLRDISSNLDPIYHELALERLRQLDHDAANIARRRIVFNGTETWRTAYERLLRSRGLYLYRSVALAKTANYWQDEPGRQSMQLNFDMRSQGVKIQRIVIVPDHLWPASERFPIEPLGEWVDQQHNHDIWVQLVRSSTLESESDLLIDLGIYGNRAVGFQEIDEQGRTVRFTLSFDFAEVLAAEQRWERLSLYATPYAEILQKSKMPA